MKENFFKSEVSKNYFGNGILNTSMINRVEAKGYLNSVQQLAHDSIGNCAGTHIFCALRGESFNADLMRRVDDIKYDIKLVQNRISELSQDDKESYAEAIVNDLDNMGELSTEEQYISRNNKVI